MAAAALGCALGAAAYAQPVVPALTKAIPEPSDLALFLMGVVGLVVGRHTARRRHRPDDDTRP